MKHNLNNHQMDELLNEARNEKPVMGMKEVENILHTGSYSSGLAFKGIHVGLNTLIVTTGIVVSSLLTYMTLKVDNANVQLASSTKVVSAPDQVTEPAVVNHEALNHSVILKDKSTADVAKPVSSTLKNQDVERPTSDMSQVTAGINNSHQDGVSNTVAKEEEAMPLKESNVALPSKKMISGEFKLEYDYSSDQKVSMKIAGDDIKELAINQIVIPPSQYSEYSEAIAEGRKILSGEHNKESSSLSLINFFDSQLHSDNILAVDSPYSFELTSSQLLINKVAQAEEVFHKYKALYESKTGKNVTEGSVYRYQKEY